MHSQMLWINSVSCGQYEHCKGDYIQTAQLQSYQAVNLRRETRNAFTNFMDKLSELWSVRTLQRGLYTNSTTAVISGGKFEKGNKKCIHKFYG